MALLHLLKSKKIITETLSSLNRRLVHKHNALDTTCTKAKEQRKLRTKYVKKCPSQSCMEQCTDTAFKMSPRCKIALVLGGTSGIGFTTACELLRNDAQHVVVTGINDCVGMNALKCLEGAFGHGKATYINADVNNDRKCEDAFQCVIDEHDNIDIVVNCVGILNGKQWEKELNTNVLGVTRATLMAYDFMGKDSIGRGGVVVNVCGTMGIEPLPGSPTYCAAKHALLGFGKSIGHPTHEYTTGIRLVTLCPGFTHTKIIEDVAEKAMCNMGHILESDIDKAKKQRPDCCGKSVIHLIKNAESGSVWVIEGSQLFKVDIPSWRKFSKLVCNFI